MWPHPGHRFIVQVLKAPCFREPLASPHRRAPFGTCRIFGEKAAQGVSIAVPDGPASTPSRAWSKADSHVVPLYPVGMVAAFLPTATAGGLCRNNASNR